MKLHSGLPKLTIPFNRTNHFQKFIGDGWELSRSARLGRDGNRIFLDIIFEKERPPLRSVGDVVGLDRGLNCMLATSKGQMIGTELKEKIRRGGKRRKSWHHYIETETNRLVKQLDLDGIRLISLERLKNVKRGTRKTFSRNMNRLLSFWRYAKVGERLQQRCETLGIQVSSKNPWKTSQRCSVCGNIDRRNRRGSSFQCTSCHHVSDADINAARNLEALGLAGEYSLRSLPSC
jgi:IS605 OrfB family transposase